MVDDIKKKRYFIYENIDKLKNHEQIINLIKNEECKFTKNSNGIFLNLSVLNKELINIIYQIVINSLDYENNEEKGIIQPLYEGIEGGKEDNFKKGSNKEEITMNIIPLIDFNKKDREIIIYSKKYNL